MLRIIIYEHASCREQEGCEGKWLPSRPPSSDQGGGGGGGGVIDNNIVNIVQY